VQIGSVSRESSIRSDREGAADSIERATVTNVDATAGSRPLVALAAHWKIDSLFATDDELDKIRWWLEGF
jgi:hypothetical protein